MDKVWDIKVIRKKILAKRIPVVYVRNNGEEGRGIQDYWELNVSTEKMRKEVEQLTGKGWNIPF